MGELEEATDAEVVEARLLADDADEQSFLIVAERDGGFDRVQLELFVEVGEDLSASPRFTPVEGMDRAFASDCCVARVIGDVAVVAGDFDGQLIAGFLKGAREARRSRSPVRSSGPRFGNDRFTFQPATVGANLGESFVVGRS